jgi:hypothetical protein
MTALLTHVARLRNVTGYNVESWVTTVEDKLADIGIVTIKMLLSEIMTVNRKLTRFGSSQMYVQTLNFMAHKGVEMSVGSGPPYAPNDGAMLLFLEAVAKSRGVTGSAIGLWVNKVHGKLRTIGATSIEATVSGIMVLNQKLQASNLSSMHGKTLDAMAQEGIAALFSIQEPAQVDAPSTDPSNDEPKMGKCLACDMIGTVGNLCISCEDSGMIYDRITETPDSSISSSTAPQGNCATCTGTGPVGHTCISCKDNCVYLNFHAGL